jgi:hypothetical protein
MCFAVQVKQRDAEVDRLSRALTAAKAAEDAPNRATLQKLQVGRSGVASWARSTWALQGPTIWCLHF